MNRLMGQMGLETVYMDLYGEYAYANGKFSNVLDFDPRRPYAAYFTSNILYNRIGLSIEYKNYNNFTFGLNDPPSLIKEHSYTLLNRSTHVLRANGEREWQIETFYNLPGSHLLTVNYSRSDVAGFDARTRSPINRQVYEYFAQVDIRHHDRLTIKYFWDYAKDESQQELNRFTFGAVAVSHRSV